MNSAGAVPRPKAAMVMAPRPASSCNVAINSTEYTKPQGIQPHTMPNANPRGSVFTGSSFRPSGASFGQSIRPMPMPGSRTRPKATNAPNNNASADTARSVRRTDSMSSRLTRPPKMPANNKPASAYEAMRPSW